MKTFVCLLIGIGFCLRLTAQAQELEQLRLDLEKLAQFKLILSEMKSGYQDLVNGYNAVRDAGRSNFTLHQNYFNSLLLISPELKTNPAIQRIISSQTQLQSNCKTMLSSFKTSGVFSANELNEVTSDIDGILAIASADFDLLNTVLAPGKMRMSDGERTTVINQVDQSVTNQMVRLKAINDEYNKIMMLRLQKKRDINMMKQLGKKQ